MAAKITSVEDRRNGNFYVNVHCGDRWLKFQSVMDAQKWLKLLKESSRGEVERIEVTLKELVIMAKREFAYTTYFAM